MHNQKSKPNWQPETLESEKIKLLPLKSEHFEQLYAVASDKLIWQQHPENNRYQRDVFELLFDQSMQSKGAFVIIDKNSEQVIGSTRYYDYEKGEDNDNNQSAIKVGYTFLARECWGKGFNNELKKLMLDYAFSAVDKVFLVVAIKNYRSQKAVEKLGATKNLALSSADKICYQLDKATWSQRQNK